MSKPDSLFDPEAVHPEDLDLSEDYPIGGSIEPHDIEAEKELCRAEEAMSNMMKAKLKLRH